MFINEVSLIMYSGNRGLTSFSDEMAKRKLLSLKIN